GCTRNSDPTRFSQFLQTSRDVDAVTVPVLAFDDHFAEIDADAHLNAPVLGYIRIALSHLALKHCRALDRVHNAPELGQQPVAHQLEDAAMVFGDLRLEQLFSVRTQAVERVRLVL